MTASFTPQITRLFSHAIRPPFVVVEPLCLCHRYAHSANIPALHILTLPSPQYAPEAHSYSRGDCSRGGEILADIHFRSSGILTRSQIRARERVVMARDCEPELREHLAFRMRRRAEVQKREADAAGRPFNVARASSPHFTSIQNVRNPPPLDLTVLICSPIDDLRHLPRSR